MNPDEIIQCASEFVFRETGRKLRVHGAVGDARDEERWSVAFEWTTPAGQKVDGPLIVIVNRRTGAAEFWSGALGRELTVAAIDRTRGNSRQRP